MRTKRWGDAARVEVRDDYPFSKYEFQHTKREFTARDDGGEEGMPNRD